MRAFPFCDSRTLPGIRTPDPGRGPGAPPPPRLPPGGRLPGDVPPLPETDDIDPERDPPVRDPARRDPDHLPGGPSNPNPHHTGAHP